MKRIALLIAAAMLAAAQLSANTFYVATNGSDSTGNGSITTPYATINKAEDFVLPGDVVYVRGGIYTGSVGIWNGGSSTARVVFQSYPGETAILDGTGLASGTDVVAVGAPYVDFIGFEIRNGPWVGFDGWGMQYGRVLNNIIHDNQHDGIYLGYDTDNVVHDDLIAGNVVYHNCLSNSARSSSGGWPQAIGIDKADNVTVMNNRVFRNYGEGIIVGYTDGVVVTGNEVFDNYSAGIYITYARTAKVDGNYVYSSGDADYYRSGNPADGIIMANEGSGSTHALSGNDVINNVVVRAHWGLGYWKSQPYGMTSCRFANNTVYNATTHALHIDNDTASSGNLIENNIFALPSGSSATLASVTSTGNTFRNNNWTANPGSPAYSSADDQIGDPAFAHAGGLLATDYQIGSTSAAKDHGRTLSYVTVDYWRKARGGTYEIGAWEY
ncbi:MAG: right-handed parallel beta-helix repeat-containing protein [Acidobacteria bacterium]|nr:right-handed parallel beta-helix repeat-containing protein [Acidobacteriota bacterium]MBV9478609.1 right-handed parallel beta-helix repeat-containing protein [Acidobacteriota bacterium]